MCVYIWYHTCTYKSIQTHTHTHLHLHTHIYIYIYTHIICKEQLPRISSKLDLSDGDASAQRFTQRASLQPRVSSTLAGV